MSNNGTTINIVFAIMKTMYGISNSQILTKCSEFRTDFGEFNIYWTSMLRFLFFSISLRFCYQYSTKCSNIRSHFNIQYFEKKCVGVLELKVRL